MTPEVQRWQRSGLSTKILVFVFCSTFATTLVVSGMAAQTLYRGLEDSATEALAAAAEAASRGLAPWAEQRGPAPTRVEPEDEASGSPPAALSPEEHEIVAAVLAEARPARVRQLLLIAPTGNVYGAALREAELPPAPLPAEAREDGFVGDYRAANGEWMVAAVAPVGTGGWKVVAQTPFQEIHAPVIQGIVRLFMVNLGIGILVSFLAYRITSTAVQPIERLSDAARRIAQGQFDHEIPEPASQDEIGLLARTFNDMMRRLRGYQSQIEAANVSLTERNNELRQAKETFEQLSITDGLTKLHNHRFFQDHLTREIKRVGRTGEPLAMLLVDIDDFKGLNDRFGHAAGDELLAGLARIMNDTVRESDLLARYGGEEFVVLASNTELEGAYSLAEKVRTAISETSFILDDSLRPTQTTVSIGVAEFRGNRKHFFQAADRALYQAKAEGKNCVIMEEAPAA